MFSNVRNYLNNKDYNINITNNYIYITNYKKINTIEKSKIRITFDSFLLIIDGENMSIDKLLDSEVLFNGKIDKVVFEYK